MISFINTSNFFKWKEILDFLTCKVARWNILDDSLVCISIHGEDILERTNDKGHVLTL